ncbi:hypothetical protein BJ875DRAFT_458811 [Amylocarpus encephaloides]|uniref:Uncharacterized protein n=1 Tax=Amylocarpus encephaloides TaxID=45428 RepID=A0A9P7YLV2_9HELO|nr:hypothetical protein BJ875DRAFT_458811 [Amylocarpus encephaloides]
MLVRSERLGEDIANGLAKASLEVKRDMEVVTSEAKGISEGWEETIVLCALNMIDNDELTKRLADIEGRREGEKAWWNNRRQTIMDRLLMELEEGYFDDLLAHPTPRQSPISRGKQHGRK